MIDSTIPRATHAGMLFDGRMDVHVLEDGTRMASQRGVVNSLRNSGVKYGNLERLFSRLPSRFGHLAAEPVIQFITAAGKRANSRPVEWITELLSAYVDAYMCGELRQKQEHLARNAHKMQMTIAKIDLVALVEIGKNLQRKPRSSHE